MKLTLASTVSPTTIAVGASMALAGLLLLRYLHREIKRRVSYKSPEGTLEIFHMNPGFAAKSLDPRTKKIAGIVIHHSETGSAASTRSVLRSRGFATCYEVDRDGKVYEYADPKLYATATTGNGANAHTIGIDLTHYGKQDFPPAQVKATQQLCRFLAWRHGFVLKVAPDDGVQRSWAEWSASGKKYSLFRHRNFKPTACPVGCPVESFV